jgi:hypothetical protein
LTAPSGTLTLQASSGNIRLSGAGGFSGSNRFVCHDNDGNLYSSATTCDGSAAAVDQRLATLRREVQELRALVAEMQAARDR